MDEIEKKFVSRGGLKLEHALEFFGLNVSGLTVLDVGSSTGGFVDCLLQHGAKKVYSVDTAYGELAWTLRNDPRVVVMERTNVLQLTELPNLTPAPLPEGEGEYGYQKTDPKTWHLLQEAALEMRKNPTNTEKILWEALRNLPPSPSGRAGVRFRRQHIIGRFIVDFVCLPKKLVIEVDGDIHDYKKEDDKTRTEYLKENGYTIIRFKNDEVTDNLGSVVNKIHDMLFPLPFGEGVGGEVGCRGGVELVDLITVDASWTKLELILPVVQKFLKPGGKIIALLKPHYQADKKDLTKGVLAEDKIKDVVDSVVNKITDLGWDVSSQTESPVLGGGGNREFLILLNHE